MSETTSSTTEFSFDQIRQMVLAAMMAALMAVGAYIMVPIGPVPIVLQNLFVMLAGLILGPWWGMGAVGIYLLAGVLGFPVFSGGGAGLGHLLGPTGGYLIGYLPAVLCIGAVSGLGRKTSIIKDVLAMILGALIVYSVGVTWLKIAAGLTFYKAIAGGMLPFLLGDCIKIAAAASIAASARLVLNRYKTES